MNARTESLTRRAVMSLVEWALVAFFSALALCVMGFSARVMYEFFMLGWRLL